MELLLISKSLVGALAQKSKNKSLDHALDIQAALTLDVQVLQINLVFWPGGFLQQTLIPHIWQIALMALCALMP